MYKEIVEIKLYLFNMKNDKEKRKGNTKKKNIKSLRDKIFWLVIL